jgi:MATE family multidrug resistance protein
MVANSAQESTLLADKSLWGQIIDHIYLAGPVVSAQLLRRVVVMSSVIAVGHLGAHYLAAAGLASVTANVTGNSMVIGLSGALTTLCSQANGANNKREMSIILQRSVIILSIFVCLPVSLLWALSEPLMVLLGQDEAIARSTKDYMVILIPGLWALSALQCINSWLYAQAKTKAIAAIAFAMAVIHPLWLWLFIYYFKIGFLGSAIALSLSKWVELIVLLVYIAGCSDIIKESEFEWSWAAWWDWGPFLRLGLPNLMMMTEWWASEIIIFMSGALPNPEVEMGAMSIYQNYLSLCFMLPAGIRESCATIVGNALGANKPGLARRSGMISPALALMGTGLMSVLILALPQQLGRVFTDDAAVVELVASLAPLMAMYILTDGLQAAYTGVVKGVGKQGIAGPIVVFSYFGVGIPLSTYMALDLHGNGLGMGVWGLCVGTLVATAVHAGTFAVVVHLRTDMVQEAALIQEQQAALRSKDTAVDSGATHNPLSLSANSSHGLMEEEESWWDAVNFLGYESKLPGRTAVSRAAPAPGLLSAAMNGIGGAWQRLVGGPQRCSGKVSLTPEQHARRRRRERAAAAKKAQAASPGTGSAPSSPGSASREYELVRAYTAALNPPIDGGSEEDDYLEIDFDFI